MLVFKEYVIDKKSIAVQTTYLPENANIVNVKSSDKGLSLIALVDPIALTTELRTFKICTDDENIYFDTVKYLGSFESDLGMRHVIELNRGD